MELNNSQYQAIMRNYEQIQARNRDLLIQRKQEIYDTIPHYQALEDSISVLSVQYGKKLIDGNPSALSALKKKLTLLRANKQEALISAGFSADYLESIYTCQSCADTGYVDNRKCFCFKQATIQILYEQSNLKEVLKRENFNTFSYEYYSENFIDRKSKQNALQIAHKVVDSCKKFVQTFADEHNQNLLLYGDVGVGKTFLTNCIAKEIMDQEYSVLYFSAPDFFNILSRSTFDKQDTGALHLRELMQACDLLIIDDLGTEFTNAFVVSQFFACINERILNGKSMIVSTNLSLENLTDLYTKRTVSRIMSDFKIHTLVGDDIRKQKRLERREEL